MASRRPALEPSPRWARWLAAVALLALAALVLAREGAALNRRLGEPPLSELVGMQPVLEATLADGPFPAEPAATRYLDLPGGWASERASAPSLLVFVDGAPLPFRRRPTDIAGELAYYDATTNRLRLALRCPPGVACRQVRVFAREGAFEAALALRRMLRSPATLLRAAPLALGSGLWLMLAARRWGPRHALPVALGVVAAVAPLALGLAATPWSTLALAVSLALLGGPILSEAWRHGRQRWSALSSGARVAVGSGLILIVVLAPLASLVFPVYLAAPPSASDHAAYLRLAQDPDLLPHFFYPLLVAALAGFSADLGPLSCAARGVLTGLVILKLGISLAFAHELLMRAGSRLSLAAAAGFATTLFLVAPLANWWQFPNVYLGQLSPTIWHNPTVIASLPFAVAAFWLLGQGERPTRLQIVGCLMLGLSVLAKPNFALAFLPTLFLLFLLGRLDRSALLLGVAATLPILGWQYQHWSAFGVTRLATTGIITLQPLEVWRLFSPHPLASLLLSIAFPLAVALFARRDARQREALVAAWLLTAIATAQFALLAEAGGRWRHGNYYWGTVPAVYILFLVSLCELSSPRPLAGGRKSGFWACWILLGLHVASGVLFYVRSLLGHGYRA